jgi:ubiquinone biosynthesis protein COQ4
MNISQSSSNQSDFLVQYFIKTIDLLTDLTGSNVPQIVHLSELRSLPIETFGHNWVVFLEVYHLKPFTKGIRRKQLHDGLHVLTGYGVDRMGEAELQAFLCGASFHSIFSVLHIILMLGLIHSIPLSEQNAKRLQSAFRRGRQSTFKSATWQPEKLWHLSLSEVKSKFKIE